MRYKAAEWALLGSGFRELEQHDDALMAYSLSLALNPECAETWHRVGVVLVLLRRAEEARAAFKRALVLDPRHGRA